MTGMDMLLASLTQEQLEERTWLDLDEAMARWSQKIDANFMRWIIEDLEKRIRE